MSIWVEASLGEILPGVGLGMDSLKSEYADLSSKFGSLSSQVALKANAAMSAFSLAERLTNSLSEAGFYMLTLEPGQGTAVSRISAASNAPSGNYTAGLVIISACPDLSGAVGKMSKLTDIISTPFKI